MALKPFEKWKYEEINRTFDYTRLYSKFTPLDNWLLDAKSIDLSARNLEMAEEMREKLVLEVDAHNEEELKVHFIIPLLNIVKIGKPNVYKLFAQRKISAMVTDVHNVTGLLAGRVEVMVALGSQIPHHPYFFIHEYKPLNKTTPSDPLGQLLAAMIVAQVTNNEAKPIYGLFVRGEDWHFVVLNGKEYAQSKAFKATEIDDLKLILQALFWIKQHIEHRIDTENLK